MSERQAARAGLAGQLVSRFLDSSPHGRQLGLLIRCHDNLATIKIYSHVPYALNLRDLGMHRADAVAAGHARDRVDPDRINAVLHSGIVATPEAA